jgi:D-arabinose 1-dehydrogenase-like Zn-dependent alcohol dehydrogenase
MRAAILEERGKPLRIGDRPDPEPGAGEVLLRVEACGVCHGDVCIADGEWDWVPLPRIIGHEVVGTVERTGPGVDTSDLGRRVGLGWLYGFCGRCRECLSGRQMLCEAGRLVTGSDADGGYATYVKAPVDSVVTIPDALSSPDAAPLLCAGVTVFNGLRRAGLRAGDRVAVVGIGGLGHLAIQYAKAAGATVVAVSGTDTKEPDALRFGADVFLTGEKTEIGARLTSAGGVDMAVVTGIDTSFAGSLLQGLRPEGALVILGVGPEFTVGTADLCMRNLRVIGSLTGTPLDMSAALELAAAHGIKPQIEQFPLAQANEALTKLRSGMARYRAVLVTP